MFRSGVASLRKRICFLLLMFMVLPLWGQSSVEVPPLLKIKDLTLIRAPVDVLYTINQQGRPACLSFTLHSSRICTRGADFYQRMEQQPDLVNLAAAQYLRHCSAIEVKEKGHWCWALQNAIAENES